MIKCESSSTCFSYNKRPIVSLQSVFMSFFGEKLYMFNQH